MKAVGFKESLPIDRPDALEDVEIPQPVPGSRDLLVAVEAVSVNPVDTKVRMRGGPETGHKILGFDAAGVVVAVGDEVTDYKVGDEIFYAGDLTRTGTNAEFHAVDERIAGRKPKSLSMADAAALPLTAITAWEILFDSFKISEGGGSGYTLLVIGGAGGVGSILIQLAKALTGLTVVATASREETRTWCREMGADYLIDHRQPIAAQIKELDLQPRYVAALNATDQHFDDIIELIKPRGEICMIDDPVGLDIMKIKRKSLSFHIEFMFARSIFQTEDMAAQQRLLNQVADLVDAGKMKSTATDNLGPMNAANLIEAHRLQESGKVIGKNVLTAIG
ncbi:zinc-binding alcohol dehydrogenase family protein [uncultured Sneathiella sp.]|uniref:zinc-binding alcohol dehydrogenase family protein n=1 Tax=uncultured Sneathiella sp. TaxID=879315 RepID=UPI0030EDCFD1|tara:strand:- start:44543 stop:45550 length:1008 start_codon:yes stop_codon:yes gene_type:complete